MKTLPWILIGAGALINIVDAYTSGGVAAKGYFYGTGGLLKAVNDALPVNFGLALMITGGGLLAWRELR